MEHQSGKNVYTLCVCVLAYKRKNVLDEFVSFEFIFSLFHEM